MSRLMWRRVSSRTFMSMGGCNPLLTGHPHGYWVRLGTTPRLRRGLDGLFELADPWPWGGLPFVGGSTDPRADGTWNCTPVGGPGQWRLGTNARGQGCGPNLLFHQGDVL